jgi:hypothetical protein
VSEEKKESKIPVSIAPNLGALPALLKAGYLSGSKKEFRTRLGGIAGLVSTVTTGIVNSTFSIATVATVSEFAQFAVIFDEFFIHKVTFTYRPYNRYASRSLAGADIQGVSSVGLGVVSLHHGAGGYSTPTVLVNNASYKRCHTGDPWTYTWVNIESPKSTVNVSAGAATPPVQGWCNTGATSAQVYTGTVQMFGDASINSAVSVPLGAYSFVADISFRARA